MKKILCLLIMSLFVLPAFAITETDEIKKAELKYQQKIEKIKKKQQIKCLKHPETCTPAQDTNMTLGVAQKNIKIGTPQDQVALTLGSPNIVTTDSDGKETWIYDKVSSVTSYNSSGFGVGIILAGYGKSKENAQSSQKTLTIVIKFDKTKKVESFQYHMSSF